MLNRQRLSGGWRSLSFLTGRLGRSCGSGFGFQLEGAKDFIFADGNVLYFSARNVGHELAVGNWANGQVSEQLLPKPEKAQHDEQLPDWESASAGLLFRQGHFLFRLFLLHVRTGVKTPAFASFYSDVEYRAISRGFSNNE